LLRLEENPRPHGVEKLQTVEKLYRVYIGPGKNYRAIYQIRDDVLLVLVVRVGDRKDVYRRVKIASCRIGDTYEIEIGRQHCQRERCACRRALLKHHVGRMHLALPPRQVAMTSA